MIRPSLDQIEKLASQLPPIEQRQLIERLSQRLVEAAPASGGAPQNLYGIWKGRFSDEFDVEGALKDIRSGWQGEFQS